MLGSVKHEDEDPMVEFSHAGDDRRGVCTRDYLQIHLQLPLHIHTLLLSVVFDES